MGTATPTSSLDIGGSRLIRGAVITADFDMPKLARSMKRAAKAFGDTNVQATARWSVQTGRELAVSTQAYGRTGTKQKQQFAIEADARRVVWPVAIVSISGKTATFLHDGARRTWPASRVLRDEQAVHDWIEMHRTRRRSRTSKLPFQELAICDVRVFRAAMKTRFALAGTAKGGWLGASNKAATFQKGAQRITIGKNFLGYAQKHARRGTARLDKGLVFRPIATLSNRARHVSSDYVLSKSEIAKAIGFGARKTIAWYRRAAKAALDKA